MYLILHVLQGWNPTCSVGMRSYMCCRDILHVLQGWDLIKKLPESVLWRSLSLWWQKITQNSCVGMRSYICCRDDILHVLQGYGLTCAAEMKSYMCCRNILHVLQGWYLTCATGMISYMFCRDEILHVLQGWDFTCAAGMISYKKIYLSLCCGDHWVCDGKRLHKTLVKWLYVLIVNDSLIAMDTVMWSSQI